MYPNLEAEMARHQIGKRDIAQAIGKDERSVRNKFNGKTSMSVDEMKIIRDSFFPKLTIDYLSSKVAQGND